MSLLSIIRKRSYAPTATASPESGLPIVTATVATLATLRYEEPPTVATVATVASPPSDKKGENRPTVATVATVAVAKPLANVTEQKAGIVALLTEAANETDQLTHYGWLITFSDQTQIYATYSPSASRDEVLRGYPDSLDAVPSKSSGVYIFPVVESPVSTQIDVDDRIICRQCQHRTYSGICDVAKRGGSAKPVDLGFASLPDLPQRCAGFAGK